MPHTNETLDLEELHLQLKHPVDGASIFLIDQQELKPTNRVLGEGNFGVVQLYHWTPKKGKRRLVAVKQVKTSQPAGVVNAAEHASSQPVDQNGAMAFLGSFIREIQIMSALSHEHVVKFVGAGVMNTGDATQAESPFIAQEYCAGGSMAKALLRQFQSPNQIEYTMTDAFSWCLGAAKALGYLHTLSPMVIHRDVKCDNILLDGEHETSKLADFGLAAIVNVKDKCLAEMKSTNPPGCDNCFNLTIQASPEDLAAAAAEAMDKSTLNQRGYCTLRHALHTVDELGRVANVVYDIPDHRLFQLTGCTGTLLTMAPEVFKSEPYSESSDIFSLAVVMYEIFSRRSMVSRVCCCAGGTHKEIYRLANNIANGFRPMLPKEWPVGLVELVNECWHQNPQSRPTAMQLACRLESLRPDITRSETMGLHGAAQARHTPRCDTGADERTATCPCCNIS